jgi:hypothetical protein
MNSFSQNPPYWPPPNGAQGGQAQGFAGATSQVPPANHSGSSFAPVPGGFPPNPSGNSGAYGNSGNTRISDSQAEESGNVSDWPAWVRSWFTGPPADENAGTAGKGSTPFAGTSRLT